MKASHKRLKAILASGVRNFGLSSVALKLVKFPLFDNFFLDLAEFQELDVFLLFDFFDLDNFPDFLVCFTLFPPIPNLSTLLSPTSSHLGVDFSDDTVVFSINISEDAILLKPWMNC